MEENKCACGGRIPNRYNSTIKDKLCPKCKLFSLHLKPIEAKTKGKSKTTRAKSQKSKHMSYADMWFSRYIRIKYSYSIQSGEVYCKCIVTGVVKHAKHMDNGHYHSRGFQGTRYNEDNCRPQNRSSNRFRGEMDKPVFGDNLKLEIGKNRFEELGMSYRQTIMVSAEYYREIGDKYKRLVKEMNINTWW